MDRISSSITHPHVTLCLSFPATSYAHRVPTAPRRTPVSTSGRPCDDDPELEQKLKQQLEAAATAQNLWSAKTMAQPKRTAVGIPTWSPTAVLNHRFTA
ncbi:hypothetical protein EJ03DRAFT_326870 [Teratosphaeria nubilosa]|uniref:Uncharacterized protein n=1 Tax=Teratosphaeria nubilosa TaxID=161662 RepID=A0A6G1LCM0_9PEZI|nr:hypothetical protein EJ03DRAFT_326870 [Teratosphaeria nubilosa]